MNSQFISLPASAGFPLSYLVGPNDSLIHRGDREDTGDNEARPAEHIDFEEELADSDGFEVMTPDDGRLGLTNVSKPPDEGSEP